MFCDCKGRCGVDMFEPKVGMSNVESEITENARFRYEGMRIAVEMELKLILGS